MLWTVSLGLCAVFVSAGLWQSGRAVRKEAMLAASARAMPAWVAFEGRFADMPALRLDNQRRGSRVGVQVYRLFDTDDGTRLWVDVGWRELPPDRVVPAEPRLPSESMRLEGLLVPPPSAGFALGPASSPLPDGGVLALRLEPAVLREAGIPPVTRPPSPTLGFAVLRLDPTLAIGYERDLDLLTNTLSPDKHRGYALQWFGFAAGLFLLSLYLQFRRRP
jgi:cytochrome oxidase assembly protein ShyY1